MSARFRPPAAEENVACNLIPMIDVMFLLLLFFMLGADMTQREREEVKLPVADACDEPDPAAIRDHGSTTVNLVHVATSSAAPCPAFERGDSCNDPSHWNYAVRSRLLTSDSLARLVADEAALELRDPDPLLGGRRLSRREVVIRSDRAAPFGLVRGAIESCAAAGVEHVVVSASRPERR
jgi:biopolymer transport protein ExbD